MHAACLEARSVFAESAASRVNYNGPIVAASIVTGRVKQYFHVFRVLTFLCSVIQFVNKFSCISAN